MDQASFEVPDEFRDLGEFRQVFATTVGAVLLSVFRSIIPLALGCGLIAVAMYWIVDKNWKFYLAVVPGILLALQGVRVLIRTLLRLRQKVLIFEKGIVISRRGEVRTFRWHEIEQVEALVAQAQGAPTSFLGFSLQGRTEEGETRMYKFHPAGDPIPNLKELWRIIEEGAGRGRTASVIAALEAGEEVTFQRSIWGKVVSTQIGISLFGISAKPRYEKERFLDWSCVARIALVDKPTAAQEEGYSSGGIAHLEVLEPFRSEVWLSELTSEIPGYQALIEGAEFAREQYVQTNAELHRERLPAALAMVAEGKEFCLARFGVSQAGFRHEGDTIPWDDLRFLRFDKENLVAPALGNRTFPYDSLMLADRWLLQRVAQSACYRHDHPEAEEEEDEEEEEKSGEQSEDR